MSNTLPEIPDSSPLWEVVKTGMALAEELVEQASHISPKANRPPTAQEREEFLDVATQLTAALIVASPQVRRMSRKAIKEHTDD